MNIAEEFLNSLEEKLNSIDASLAINDQNSALKKTHESIAMIKHYKDELHAISNDA